MKGLGLEPELGIDSFWADNSFSSSISLSIRKKAQDIGATEGTVKGVTDVWSLQEQSWPQTDIILKE